MKVHYKPLSTASDEDRKPLHPTQTKIHVGATTVYERACMPICKVVNYDAFPGSFLGKGCCGFLGYLPMVVSGLVTTGLGLATTALVYSFLPEEERNPDLTVAIGVGASVLLGSMASAISCYRTSMCCGGTDKIKYMIKVKSKERLITNKV